MSSNDKTLNDIISKYVQLDPPNSRGWMPVLCKVCGDRGHKGKRAAFKFDGDATAYNCFNCGPDGTAVYDPEQPVTDRQGGIVTLSKRMITVLEAYGVPPDEYNQVIFNNLDRITLRKTQDKPQFTSLEPASLQFPKFFYFLEDADDDDKWAFVVRAYLEDRGIDPESYPFMLANTTNNRKLDEWRKRVIIPIFKDKKLIYYQGRDLTGKAIRKYKNPTVDRGRVLYGFQHLFTDFDKPLFITEGWFDAYSIGGVAIMGNSMMDEQIEILNRSRRQKVYIPDRLGSGDVGADQAIEQGWCIATPEIGACKDMNDAVSKYGRMYVMKTLMENISDGFEAQTRLQVYCD